MKNETETGKNIVDQRIDSIENELGEIQRKLDEKRPWYKNITIIISILAFIISTTTTGVSLYRINKRDYLEARSELRSIIIRLVNNREESIKIRHEDKNDSMTKSLLIEGLNKRNVVLAEQGQFLLDQIENSYWGEGSVFSSEFLVLSDAFSKSSINTYEENLLKAAVDRATDVYSAVTALRLLAQRALEEERYDEMKKYYENAIGIFDLDSTDEVPEISVLRSRAVTYIGWARGEAQRGSCESARRRILDADKSMDSLEEISKRFTGTRSLVKRGFQFVKKLCPVEQQ